MKNHYFTSINKRAKHYHLLSLFLLLLFSFIGNLLYAQTAGPNNPGTGTDDNSVGAISWTDPGNITSPGSPYTTASITHGASTHYLKGTNYGFTIPSGAIIKGITVVINRQQSTGNSRIYDNVVNLIKGGTIIGDNKASATVWPQNLTTPVTYGGTSDLWGTTWTPEEINNSNFGLALQAYSTASLYTYKATVDYMQITVTYVTPAAEPTTQASNVTFSAVSGTGMTIGWTKGNGTNSLVVVKEGSAVNSDPVDGTSYIPSTTFGSGTQIGTGNYVVYNGTGSSVAITGLSSSTTYYVAVYAFNGTGGTENYLITNPATGNQTTTAASGDYRSAASGNWGTAGTWQTYNGSSWVTAGIAPSSSSGKITIRNGHTVTVAAAASADQCVIESGGQVTVNSGQTWTIANGSGTDLTVNGTVVNSGTMTMNGTGTFSAGSTYQHAQNGGTIPTATWNANSTCLISGVTTTIPTVETFAQSFGNFTWNCASQTGNLSLIGNLTTINGNFTITNTNSGSLRLSNYGITATLDIGGNLTQTNGTFYLGGTGGTYGSNTWIVNVSGNFELSGGTLNMAGNAGSSSLNVTGNFTLSGGTLTETGSATNNIYFNGTSMQTYTSGSTVSNTVNFTVNSGAYLQMAAAVTTVTGGGAFTLSSGGTLGITSVAGITSSGNTGNIQINGTRSFSTGANYIYNGSGSQATGSGLPTGTITGNITLASGANVTTTNSIVENGTLTVNGTLIPGAAAQVMSGTGTLTGTGTVQVNRTTATADFSSQYTISNKTLTNLTVEYIGSAAQVVSALTYGGLKINNSNGVSLGGNATVNSTLTFTAGKITTNSNLLSLGSSASVTGAGVGKYVYGNLLWNIPTGSPSRTFTIGDASNYTPIAVDFTGVTTPGTLTGFTTAGEHPQIVSSPVNQDANVNRYWTLNNSSTVFTSYNATFNFVAGDVDGGANTADFIIGKYGTGWESPTVGTRTSTSTQATGMTTFSSFAAGQGAFAPNCSGNPSNQSVCEGSSTSFTGIATANPQPTASWEYYNGSTWQTVTITSPYSVSNSWNNGTNTITSTLTINPTATSQNNYQYRVIFTNNKGDCTTSAATLTVTANLSAVNVTPTGSQSLCMNASGTQLSAAETGGGAISSRQWGKRSTSGGTITDITGATGSTYTPTGADLGEGTWYVVCRSTPTCGLVGTSNEVTVTVNPHSWTGTVNNDWKEEGNWCGGVPTASTNVVIPGSATVHVTNDAGSSAECNNLTIESGGVLTIDAGKALTVYGSITKSSNDNDLVIKSDASGTGSLLHSTTGVHATLERYIDNSGTSYHWDWHLLASPVASQAIWPQFAPTPTYLGPNNWNLSWGSNPQWDFYYYNPNCPLTGLYWVNLRWTDNTYNYRDPDLTNSDAGFGKTVPPVMIPSRGYLAAYYSETGTTHQFAGTLNTGSQSYSATNQNDYYNLVGNPYPSYIDWQSSSLIRTNLEDLGTSGSPSYAFWIWNEDKGNYGAFTSTGGTVTPPGINGTSRYIAPSQGFFVKANSKFTTSTQIIGFSQSARTHATQGWLKDTEAATNYIKLVLTTAENTYSDELVVFFDENNNGDYGVEKLASWNSDAPELYSVKEGTEFCIDMLKGVTHSTVINVSAKCGVSGNYTIAAPGINEFALCDEVYLEDLLTGNKIDLRQINSYSFAGGPNDDRARFKLTFAEFAGTNETETIKPLYIYSVGKDVYINANQLTIGRSDVFIYDAVGRLVYRGIYMPAAGNARYYSLTTPGAYVVKAIARTGTVTAKIIIP